MELLAPAALFLLAAVPLLLLLRARRRPIVRVPSLLLWRPRDRDGTARLTPRRWRDPLLLLQVLFLSTVIAALARPALRAGGRDVVFLFDASASMGAREAGGTRFALARARALEILDALPRRDRVRLLEARARTRAASGFLTDRRELRRRILALEPTQAPADLAAALLPALAAAGEEGRVYVFSDGAANAGVPEGLALERVRWVRVGAARDNAAVVRLASRPSRTSPFDHDLFAEVVNFAPRPRRTSLVIAVDGRELLRRPLVLGAGERRGIALETALAPGSTMTASLEGADALAADDRAFAAIPSAPARAVLLVSAGNRYLETALAVDPTVVLTVVEPRAWRRAPAAERFDAVVLDGVAAVQPEPPRVLAFRPPSAAEVASGRALDRPRLTPRPGAEPALAAPALAAVEVETAAPLALPAGTSVLVEAAGQPVLTAWERGPRRRIVVGFDPRASSWPQTVSFPVFVANALRWLAPVPGGDALQLVAGEPLRLSLPAPYRDLTAATVEDPAGVLADAAVRDGALVYEDTESVGLYTLRAGAYRASFAVNLASAAESDIAPVGARDVPTSDRRRGVRATPGAVEIGRAVLGAALALLLAEWLLYARRRAA